MPKNRFFQYQCIIKPLLGFNTFYGFYSGVINYTSHAAKIENSRTLQDILKKYFQISVFRTNHFSELRDPHNLNILDHIGIFWKKIFSIFSLKLPIENYKLMKYWTWNCPNCNEAPSRDHKFSAEKILLRRYARFIIDPMNDPNCESDRTILKTPKYFLSIKCTTKLVNQYLKGKWFINMIHTESCLIISNNQLSTFEQNNAIYIWYNWRTNDCWKCSSTGKDLYQFLCNLMVFVFLEFIEFQERILGWKN